MTCVLFSDRQKWSCENHFTPDPLWKKRKMVVAIAAAIPAENILENHSNWLSLHPQLLKFAPTPMAISSIPRAKSNSQTPNTPYLAPSCILTTYMTCNISTSTGNRRNPNPSQVQSMNDTIAFPDFVIISGPHSLTSHTCTKLIQTQTIHQLIGSSIVAMEIGADNRNLKIIAL